MFEPMTLLVLGGLVALVAVVGGLRPIGRDADPFYV